MFKWLLWASLGALVGAAPARAQSFPTTAGAPQEATTQPSGCDIQSPSLREGWRAFIEQEGKTADEVFERLLCQQLAAKMTGAYASLSNLTFESRNFEAVHRLEAGEAWKLTYDESAPLIARVKCYMRPADQMRAEAYVNDKLVWGLVSSARENGKSSVVQWSDKKQTKPFPVQGWGRNAYCDDAVPGHCTLGVFLESMVGPSEGTGRTQVKFFAERIANGRYEGMVPAATGDRCHCVSFVVGRDKQMLFKYYVHPKSHLVVQVDKIEAVLFPGEKVGGVGSQRWTYENTSNDAIDDAMFVAPDPGGRKLIDVKP